MSLPSPTNTHCYVDPQDVQGNASMVSINTTFTNGSDSFDPVSGLGLTDSIAKIKERHATSTVSANDASTAPQECALSNDSLPLPMVTVVDTESIIEVNRSFARSFHATPVIECQNVSKQTLVKKSRKMLNMKYILHTDHVLGIGSYGKVILCYSIPDKVFFAMKILRRHALRRQGVGSDSGLAKYQREVDVLKMLRHDNIIALHEVIDDGVSPKIYLVFELAAYGEVLRLRPDGRLDDNEEVLPEDEVRRVMQGTVSAVAHAHLHRVAHRDIKPANILIDAKQCVKLSDFGCAIKDVAVAEGRTVNRDGSIAFLPPELLRASTAVVSRATSSSTLLNGLKRSTSTNSASDVCGLRTSASTARRCDSTSLTLCADHYPNSLLTASTSPVTKRNDSSYLSERNTSSVAGLSFVPSVEESSVGVLTACSSAQVPPESDDFVSSAATLILAPSQRQCPSELQQPSEVDFFKADIWSLGVTGFIMLFGQLPWTACNAATLLEEMDELPDPFERMANSSPVNVEDDGTEPFDDDSPPHLAATQSERVAELASSSGHPAATKECIDFLRLCLARNPADRPTAQDLLQHPWLCAAAAADSTTIAMSSSAERPSVHESTTETVTFDDITDASPSDFAVPVELQQVLDVASRRRRMHLAYFVQRDAYMCGQGVTATHSPRGTAITLLPPTTIHQRQPWATPPPTNSGVPQHSELSPLLRARDDSVIYIAEITPSAEGLDRADTAVVSNIVTASPSASLINLEVSGCSPHGQPIRFRNPRAAVNAKTSQSDVPSPICGTLRELLLRADAAAHSPTTTAVAFPIAKHLKHTHSMLELSGL